MKVDFSVGIAKTDRDNIGLTTISHSNPADSRIFEDRFNFREISDLTIGSSSCTRPFSNHLVSISPGQTESHRASSGDPSAPARHPSANPLHLRRIKVIGIDRSRPF